MTVRHWPTRRWNARPPRLSAHSPYNPFQAWTPPGAPASNPMKAILASLQRIGGALMLPIAVLPIAGLLLRFGQPDLLNFPSMAAAGDAIINNLGLLFA